MVIAAPSLLTFSIHEKLEPAVAYLVARLDLTPEQLTRIVTRFPSTLLYSVRKNLEPTIR